jgi:hypothetical protein
MKITRENYEPYFLDYLEGNLDENLVDDFMEFLQQNPDLKNELEMYESITIPDFTAEYEAKKNYTGTRLTIPRLLKIRLLPGWKAILMKMKNGNSLPLS